MEERVQGRQQQQKTDHDKRSRVRQFAVGERVFVRNHGRSGDRWLSGTITGTSGPLSFKVDIENGRSVKCHRCCSWFRLLSSFSSMTELRSSETQDARVREVRLYNKRPERSGRQASEMPEARERPGFSRWPPIQERRRSKTSLERDGHQKTLSNTCGERWQML